MGLNNFPYSNFHELNADWIIKKIKEFSTITEDFEELKTYVQNYFDNLNLSDEVRTQLSELIDDGYIESIVSGMVSSASFDKLYAQITTAQTIGCIGDSITYGHAVSVEQVDDPYPKLLGNWLVNYKAGTVVNNYGVSGAASTEYLAQFNQAVNDGCDIIIFMFGHNDLRLNGGIDQVLTSAKGFINNCKTRNIVPIVSSVPIYYGTTESRIDGGVLLANGLKSICEQFGAIYIPMYEETAKILNCGKYSISGVDNALLPDGVHWESYYVIASVIMRYAFPMYIGNNADNIFPSWRAPGTIINNASIPTVTYSENGRIVSLVALSTYQFGFYSDKPFKLQTISHDNIQGALVTWSIIGEHPINITHDYYQNTESPTTYQAQIVNLNNDLLPPGYYTVVLSSLRRGQTPQAHTPILRLSSIKIDKYDFDTSGFITA